MNKAVLDHFKKNDPLLYSFVLRTKISKTLKKESPKNYFVKLCREIIGQQLSGRVAEVIFERFKKLYKGEIVPQKVIETPHEVLRGVGMSNAKAKYVKSLAAEIIGGGLDLDRLDELTDDEVKDHLLRVKGIGPWTAEMFLIFTLGRPDIFSHGDLGLKKGIKKVYGLKKDPSRRTVEKIIKKWSPYKSFASLILWESLEVE